MHSIYHPSLFSKNINISNNINRVIFMNSKTIRKIVLRTPWSRRLRLNLRILLDLAVKEKLSRLSNLEIWKEKNALERQFCKSTLRCSMGVNCVSFERLKKKGFDPRDLPTNLDLVWVPWLEHWYCNNCFELNHFSEMTHEDFDDPVTREWVKNEFGI